MLKHIIVEPKEKAVASVIWLHGLGADGHDFEPIVPQLKLPNTLPMRFIFPHAPLMSVTLNGGYVMPAWFDIISLGSVAEVDLEGLKKTTEQISLLVEAEHKKGIPYENIFLAGFSQGGSVALHCGLSYPKKLGGILALSTFIPTPQLKAYTGKINHIPILIAHGTYDDVLPFAFGKETFENLKSAGLPIEMKVYSMSHSVCAEEIQDISTWLQGKLSSWIL